MKFNMSKPVFTRVGRRIKIYSKHSPLNGRRMGKYDIAPSLELEPYKLTFYDNAIIVSNTDDLGSTVFWIPLSDILSIKEFQAEGEDPIKLSLPKTDGLGNVLQE